MKKILIIILFVILTFIIFNKTIFSKVIVLSLSKWLERDFLVKKINIDYSKNEIVLSALEIRNDSKFYYNNLFEADKIQIKYSFQSIFTDLVKIDYLIIENLRVFLEFSNKNNQIVDDNMGLVEKYDDDYKPKIYPKKYNDKNFLIIETKIINPKAFIKTLNSNEKIEINLSDMSFYKVANITEHYHYKEVFKIILNDLFLKIPDEKLKKLIKKAYKL